MNEDKNLLDTISRALLQAPISISLITVSFILIAISIAHGRYIHIGTSTLVYAVFAGYWRLLAKDQKFAGSYWYHIPNFILLIIWAFILFLISIYE